MTEIAYLTNQYPAISHTFITREVRGLRALGVSVTTLSIQRADPDHLRAPVDQQEFATTEAVLPSSPLRILRTHLWALTRNPRRYVATLAWGLRIGRGRGKGSLWQLFYFAEAIVVARMCSAHGAGHLHAHFTTPPADVAMLAARYLGISFSFSAHGTDIQASDEGLLATKVREASLVVCVSDFGRSQILSVADHADWHKVHVVRCGIDLARYDAPREPHPAPVRILNVGRLHPVKGHTILLDAVARLPEGSVHLTIVGDGDLRESLEAQTARLGLQDVVEFAGNVGEDRVPEFYEAADIFCLPSFGEGIPVVLMEAMALRLPVVASRIMGIPELVEDGETGLLVAPGRADLLAGALEALVADPQRRLAMGEAGRARVTELHDIDTSARELAELFARTT